MASVVTSKRINYIDIAKGIGIILVVLGHCGSIPAGLNHFIFSVHMPLFFILSGYTFSRKNCDKVGKYILKCMKALLIPYALAAAAVVILRVIEAIICGGSPKYELVKWIVSGVYGSGTRYPVLFENAGIPITYIGAIWFLLALCWAKILLALFLKTRTPALWVMVSFIVGYVSAQKWEWMPFSIQAGMCAVLFLYIGFIIKEKKLFEWNSVHWSLKLLMLAVWIYCIIFCGRMWMVSNTYSDGFVDIIGGICGTFIIVYIAQGMEKIGFLCRPFTVLGKISLGIMCAHLIVLDCWPMSMTAGYLTEHLQVSYCICEICIMFIVTAAITLIMYAVPWINKKMYPAYFGQ